MQILLTAKEDPAAMEKAVKMNMGLVRFVLNNLRETRQIKHLVDADDLLQAGTEGLVKALHRFENLGKGYQTYFIKYIEGYMLDALSKRHPINISAEAFKQRVIIIRAFEKIAAKNKINSATESEDLIAATAMKLKLSYHEVNAAVRAGIPTAEQYDPDKEELYKTQTDEESEKNIAQVDSIFET